MSNYSSKLLLICPQQKDAFTVNDAKYGNRFLEYLIGLLSADEFWLAGGNGIVILIFIYILVILNG